MRVIDSDLLTKVLNNPEMQHYSPLLRKACRDDTRPEISDIHHEESIEKDSVQGKGTPAVETNGCPYLIFFAAIF